MDPKERPSIFYRHFDLPANFPVIALLGPSWIALPEPVTRMHFHNCLEIGYLYEGRGQLYIDDRIIPIEAPCITLAPPNVPHYTRAEDGSLCRWNWLYTDPIELLGNLSPRLSNALNQYQRTLAAEACAIPAEQAPEAHALIRMIIDEIGGQRAYCQDVTRELFHAFFLLLLRAQPDASARPHRVNRRMGCIEPAISYIVEKYMNDVNIDELARLCHVSASHFRRLFKQALGLAPQEYLQIIRVDRACALLYNCDFSVTEIGAQVGYPSPSSFSRQFKRMYGMSPSQWRQKMRSEENPVVNAYFNALPPTTLQFFPTEYT